MGRACQMCHPNVPPVMGRRRSACGPRTSRAGETVAMGVTGRPRTCGHLVLLRCDRPEDVEVVETLDGTTVTARTRLPRRDLPAYAAARETERPRWTWDCTTRWYPELLRAGVRVERCWDLRLTHDLLRGSPLATPAAGHDSGQWDGLGAADPTVAALFDGHDLLGLDVLGELGRQRQALAAADHHGLGLLVTAESSGALVAAEMTRAGVPWRADVHADVLTALLGPRPLAGHRPAVLERLLHEVRDALGAPALNPDSPGSLLQALQGAGLPVDDTRSWTLSQLDHPVVQPLLAYKKLARLAAANGWQWLDTWVQDGRFRTDFLVSGVVTGRWSARGGGALMVPAELRRAVVADEGWRLVVADAAQLEPRVLAGMAGDTAMAAAGRGRDLYAGLVSDGAVATRAEAKLGVISAMYGGTRGESGRMVARLAERYPAAFGLVEEAARAGERGEVVRTLLGRGSPVPRGAWTQQAVEDHRTDRVLESQRRSWGRFTRNFVVQGTAAEWALCWLALLRNRLWRTTPDLPAPQRPQLVMFLHDEVVVHSPAALADQVATAVQDCADEAGRLLFGPARDDLPLDVPLDVAVVRSWAEAT